MAALVMETAAGPERNRLQTSIRGGRRVDYDDDNRRSMIEGWLVGGAKRMGSLRSRCRDVTESCLRIRIRCGYNVQQ
jgi:hypothetical protein